LVPSFPNQFLLSKDKQLRKKMAEYNDLHSSENLDKMRSEIYSISSIMSENIELILERDKTI